MADQIMTVKDLTKAGVPDISADANAKAGNAAGTHVREIQIPKRGREILIRRELSRPTEQRDDLHDLFEPDASRERQRTHARRIEISRHTIAAGRGDPSEVAHR